MNVHTNTKKQPKENKIIHPWKSLVVSDTIIYQMIGYRYINTKYGLSPVATVIKYRDTGDSSDAEEEFNDYNTDSESECEEDTHSALIGSNSSIDLWVPKSTDQYITNNGLMGHGTCNVYFKYLGMKQSYKNKKFNYHYVKILNQESLTQV